MPPSKRAFDVIVAGLALIALSPVIGLIALWIRVVDGKPVFFRQVRIGKGGAPFRIWKFRTMVMNAGGPEWPLAVDRDERVTRTGRWLRQTRLDELPQLLNVLSGEMSMVGPRPEVPRYLHTLTLEERRVLELVPGITGPATIRFRNQSEALKRYEDPEAAYVSWILPEKARINLEYAGRATIGSDCVILIRTVAALLTSGDVPDVGSPSDVRSPAVASEPEARRRQAAGRPG